MAQAVLKTIIFDEKAFRQAPFAHDRSYCWMFDDRLTPELHHDLPAGQYALVVSNSGNAGNLTVDLSLFLRGRRVLCARIPLKAFLCAPRIDQQSECHPALALQGQDDMSASVYRHYTLILSRQIGRWFREHRLIMEEIADGLMNSLQDYELALSMEEEAGVLDFNPLDMLRPAEAVH